MKNFGIHFVTRTLIAALLSAFCLTSGVFAQEQSEADELSDLSLGDLLNLEITVATKTGMTLEEAPAIVSVITGDEIRNMGARNLADVLRTVPGFDVTRMVGFPSHITAIRGSGDYDSVKVMMNGHMLRAMASYYDIFPISTVRRIEIIRGPGSALYGAGAFFGIINIITKQGGEEPSKISLERGSYATVKPSGEFSYKKNDFRAWLYADYHTTDGYDGIIESDMTDNSEWFEGATPGEMTGDGRYYNVQANISYKNFYLMGMLSADDLNNPVGIAKALSDENEIKDKYYFGEIGYKGPLSEKGNLTFRMFYERFEMDRFWEIFPEETAEMEMHTGFPPGEGLNGNPLFKTYYLGGEIQADYEFGRGLQLVGGAHYEFKKVFDVKSIANYNPTGAPLEVDGITYPGFPYQYFHTGWTDISENGNWLDESEQTIRAYYAQGIFDLKELFSLTAGVENLSFTAGVRCDDYDDVGSTTNPRFGIVYAPTEKFWFKGLHGTAFRAPSSGELYVKNNPSWTGNRNLKPEELETLECLVGYNLTRNISSSLTYYNIKTENLIILSNREQINAGEAESNGFEAEVKINFDRFRYAYLNFTWQDVKNTTHPDYHFGWRKNLCPRRF